MNSKPGARSSSKPAPELCISNDWNIPPGVCSLGQVAARIIRDYCFEKDLAYTGGCTVFHDPKQWHEAYGKESLLVVTHDGGAYKPCVSLRDLPGDLELYAQLDEYLLCAGFQMEECTNWYTAIYEKEE
jgi:hypothetical protein